MSFTHVPLILFEPLTTTLIYLLRDKANDGLDCLDSGFTDLAEERYAEAIGALQLWEAAFEQPLRALSKAERAEVDQMLGEDLRRLDCAISLSYAEPLQEVAP